MADSGQAFVGARIAGAGAAVLVAGLAGLWLSQETGGLAAGALLHAAATISVFALLLRAAAAERRRDERLLEGLTALSDHSGEQPRAPRRPTVEAALDAVSDRLSASSAHIAMLAERLSRLPDQVAGAMQEVEHSASEQEAAVEETASLLANINKQVADINAEVENLARSNEETAASIQEMSTAIEQVAVSSHALQETVESSTASIHEMGSSIQRVAQSSDEVQQVAEGTAAAITEMDRAIQEVGEHVHDASDLTRKLSESAEQGSLAVAATIQGIAAIRDQTLGAKGAIEGLAERIGEIGEIATVIGGVSDETNLLSLNAAIIAAQAGEHGKAFAVVADQVKTLAQRTSASAKQIEEMILAVQAESAKTVRAMAAGIESVEEGVERSRLAGETLETIRTAARDASGQVQEIARATEEQSRNSKHVADAAQSVSQHVQQISTAMSEQTQASTNLLRNADSSLDMCRQMASALEEQRSTGRYITANSESITLMIHNVQASTESHFHASSGVADRFTALLENAQNSWARIPDVSRVVAELARAAESSPGATDARSPEDDDA